MRPRLALVPGEPAGVGPELCVRALQRDWDADLVVFDSRAHLQRAADAIGLGLPDLPDCDENGRQPLSIVDVPWPRQVLFGTPDPANAQSVISALTGAAQACLDGRLDGMVTGPVHKAIINQAGFAFTGATDLLAAQTGSDTVMMLANPIMRVALATVHVPLFDVPDLITRNLLLRTLRVLARALREDFGIAAPRIAVLGLNPHAGEDGYLGDEERRHIAPVIAILRKEGLQLSDPLPADTAFLPEKLAQCDAVLAMYHDQGLAVLKYADFRNAVNISLGLPFIRTAVDHGTALDIAGRGIADPSSLFAAIDTCTALARRRMAGITA